ncbi:hypothetical protein M378DRAFT_173168 [Amanita muscaria Koide BX008]|uniref:Uncharacterized protein n=1 Tax=Amanita muscaria (strain Koide BX008) TaxID=946122 RepID=A0A0C2WGZ1_AMAMK|nr:hypothetical protein M378DRAFT_173168 [Amanita muscaria Koide BX008]
MAQTRTPSETVHSCKFQLVELDSEKFVLVVQNRTLMGTLHLCRRYNGQFDSMFGGNVLLFSPRTVRVLRILLGPLPGVNLNFEAIDRF